VRIAFELVHRRSGTQQNVVASRLFAKNAVHFNSVATFGGKFQVKTLGCYLKAVEQFLSFAVIGESF
jgi:hypothetical protein